MPVRLHCGSKSPMTGTLETFVTFAAIQLAIRRLARS